MFKKNAHPYDQALKLVMGGVMANVGYFWVDGYWSYFFYGLALLIWSVPVLGSCVVYSAFNFDSHCLIKRKADFKIIVAMLLVGGVFLTLFTRFSYLANQTV